jgi:hypothetical protein
VIEVQKYPREINDLFDKEISLKHTIKLESECFGK